MRLQAYYFEVPNEEQRERARKSVNSTPESIKKDVQHLIEWYEKQPHLPNYKDEDVLAHSLLQCNNSLEKVKRRLEKYCIARASFPEIFCNRNPYEKCLEVQKNDALYVPLRKLTPDGFRVAMLYISDDFKNKTDIPPMDNFFKMNYMFMDLGTKLDYAKGIILIQDGSKANLSIVAAVSPHLRKILFLNEKAAPLSFVKIYILNVGRAADIMLTLVKPFMKKKIVQRIEILKNPTDLCKVLPKDIIPSDYGGNDLPLEQLKDLWFEDLKTNYEYLKYVEQFTPDLSKLPTNYSTTELSGMVGSFRQISVD